MKRIALITGILALVVSGYLFWVSLGTDADPYGCGSGSGCDEVLGSRWSSWIGIPVSRVGAVVYGLFVFCLAANCWLRSVGTRISRLLILLSFTGLVVILWFIVIQVLILNRLCMYCLTVHFLGGITFIMYLTHESRQPGQSLKRMQTIVPALCGAGLFIVLHLWFLPDAVLVQGAEDVLAEAGEDLESDPLNLGSGDPERIIRVLNDAISFKASEVPFLGDPKAEHVMLELFDYTCPHCRELHQTMKSLEEKYPGKVALAVFPMPLDKRCNPHVRQQGPRHAEACDYARYSMAVRQATPHRFAAFHDWLMTGKMPPSVKDVLKKATTVIGEDNMKAALQDPKVAEWIRDGVSVYKATRGGGIPKLITDKHVIVMSETGEAKVIPRLEEVLGLK